MTKSRFTHGPSRIRHRPAVAERIRAERLRIGACLRAHRHARGWTRRRAAEAIGLHPVSLARIERGTANATIDTLTAVANAYDVSLKALFHGPPAECECG